MQAAVRHSCCHWVPSRLCSSEQVLLPKKSNEAFTIIPRRIECLIRFHLNLFLLKTITIAALKPQALAMVKVQQRRLKRSQDRGWNQSTPRYSWRNHSSCRIRSSKSSSIPSIPIASEIPSRSYTVISRKPTWLLPTARAFSPTSTLISNSIIRMSPPRYYHQPLRTQPPQINPLRHRLLQCTRKSMRLKSNTDWLTNELIGWLLGESYEYSIRNGTQGYLKGMHWYSRDNVPLTGLRVRSLIK